MKTVVQYCATFLKPEMLHIYRQITGLEKFRTVVFAQKRENAEQFPFADVVLIPKPRTHFARRIWQKQIRRVPVQIYRSEVRRITRELQRVDAALLHIYFGHIAVHLLPLIEAKPLPVVVSFHGADVMVDMDRPSFQAATREMLKRVDLVLVRSESLLQRLCTLGCDREKIRVHRTGIPLDRFRFAQRTPPENGAWSFLQACRLIEKKGLHTSLRAFARFAQTFPAATFTIAGEGPMLDELKRSANELGIAGKVRFAGFATQEELQRLLYEAHFFLHPSELGHDGNQEGVPNSMLEAMATGLPPLSTIHGGIPEAVENGVSGFLVNEGDAGALSDAMLRLAGDAELYKKISANAANAVASKFDLHAQARALEGFYEEALQRARGC